jgi:hypothetical protein
MVFASANDLHCPQDARIREPHRSNDAWIRSTIASRRPSSTLLWSAASDARSLNLATRGSWLANPGAPKYHDRLMNFVLFKQQFMLEIVDL